MKIFLTIIGIILCSKIYGQDGLNVTKYDPSKPDSSYIICEMPGQIMAQFPGGYDSLQLYIEENLNWDQGQIIVSGTVYIQFDVLRNGKLKNVEIVRGMGEVCPTCDKAALELINKMPKWTPAIDDGKMIKSKVIIPIKFDGLQ
ncbi:energy transducer TonB [Chryseotalea sanaruensis]|nr:energy transducer TonB [Chryseotalea sanaruensis]